jgi:hypothetical protein
MRSINLLSEMHARHELLPKACTTAIPYLAKVNGVIVGIYI